MADLQDKAAQNRLLAVGGMPPKARFKVELICIVDMDFRAAGLALFLPSSDQRGDYRRAAAAVI